MAINEAALVAWFAVHPFTRTVTIMLLTAIVIKVKQDWEDYKKELKREPDTPYLVWVMVKKCIWGTVTVGVMSIVPTVLSEIFKILGGGQLPTP